MGKALEGKCGTLVTNGETLAHGSCTPNFPTCSLHTRADTHIFHNTQPPLPILPVSLQFRPSFATCIFFFGCVAGCRNLVWVLLSHAVCIACAVVQCIVQGEHYVHTSGPSAEFLRMICPCWDFRVQSSKHSSTCSARFHKNMRKWEQPIWSLSGDGNEESHVWETCP